MEPKRGEKKTTEIPQNPQQKPKKRKKKVVMRSGCEDLREDYEGSGINRIIKEKHTNSAKG
jgi:hypothetical protein